MSCCGGYCGCGCYCRCGPCCRGGCGGCRKYSDLSYSEATTAAETLVLGVAPQKTCFEESEVAAETAASAATTAPPIHAQANE